MIEVSSVESEPLVYTKHQSNTTLPLCVQYRVDSVDTSAPVAIQGNSPLFLRISQWTSECRLFRIILTGLYVGLTSGINQTIVSGEDQ